MSDGMMFANDAAVAAAAAAGVRTFGREPIIFCASCLSACVPWRSPLPSFLKAYATEIGLLQRNWPFIFSIAASELSNESKFMKA